MHWYLLGFSQCDLSLCNPISCATFAELFCLGRIKNKELCLHLIMRKTFCHLETKSSTLLGQQVKLDDNDGLDG